MKPLIFVINDDGVYGSTARAVSHEILELSNRKPEIRDFNKSYVLKSELDVGINEIDKKKRYICILF